MSSFDGRRGVADLGGDQTERRRIAATKQRDRERESLRAINIRRL